MKIWLSKNSEIPIREQIITQITLGIISGDLAGGERIPSTREIAGRFQIHANTVSAAYQKLLERGLIELKKGSGFYVSQPKIEQKNDESQLDSLIVEFFRKAQSCGFSRDEIAAHLQKSFAAKASPTIIVVEPNEYLRAILVEEIRAVVNFRVIGVSPAEFEAEHCETNYFVAAMADKKAVLAEFTPDEKACIWLIARSVSSSMKGKNRPNADELIAVVSGWDDFLTLAKTVLIAANIEADSIISRSTKDANWRKGLKNASLIICDSLTANEFGDDARIRPFQIISDNSLQELTQIIF